MANGVEVATIKVTVEQALDVQYLLAKGTPVDVATARSNWRINIGRAYAGKVRAYSPYPSRHRKPYGSGGSISETSNLNQVVAQGKSRLAGYKSGSIFISNNVPYIGVLNRGHSPQSSGFVARAVSESVSRTRGKIPKIFDKELSK